jgi:predicted nucleic acid-binding protein
MAFMRQLTQRPLTSVVVVAELYAGVRDGPERKQLDHFLTGVRIVSVDQEIAIEGGLYRRAFGKSHGVGLADALIAATAKKEHAHLVTSNHKHFPMLADVVVPYAKA